jgi:predicted transglutaminase-like cysteine proteinase
MQILKFIIFSFLCVHSFGFNDGPIDQDVMKKAERKYGGLIVSRYLEYNKLLAKAQHTSARGKLKVVNDFINQIPFQSDITNWKEEDYWATPLELLARNKGDSEDYVIAKYFALKTLGIDTKQLYFTYVNSKKFNRPHMVLSYFETPSSEPFILDNMNPDILAASQRPDLTPVYNFNPSSNDSKDSQDLKQSTHKKWEKLNKRVQRNKL